MIPKERWLSNGKIGDRIASNRGRLNMVDNTKDVPVQGTFNDGTGSSICWPINRLEGNPKDMMDYRKRVFIIVEKDLWEEAVEICQLPYDFKEETNDELEISQKREALESDDTLQDKRKYQYAWKTRMQVRCFSRV